DIGAIGAIEQIEILTNERTYRGSGRGPEKWAPRTHETADHSLPYVVAIALIDGTVSPSSYADERLNDGRVLGLMKKITVREDAALTSLFPEKSATILRVVLKSGQVLVEKVEYPKGHPKHPVTDEEIESKFRHLVRGFVNESQVDAILNFVWTLE